MRSEGPAAARISRAHAGDAVRLARLRYEFRTELASPAEPESSFLRRCAAWMEERLASADWHCWIAEDDSHIVGQVWLQFIEKIPNPVDEPESHAYISSLYVLPGRRGQGIGEALLRAAIDLAASHEVHAILLWPTDRSRSLYERHGFAVRDDVMELILTR
jgi:ribosomal protein S18 acetylase RimI-like enzyme